MATYDATFSSRSNQALRLTINQSSQSVTGNYSNVSWSLHLVRLSGVGSWVNNPTGSYSITVNGTSYTGTVPGFNLQSSSSKLIRSGTTRVNHNSNGTKTFSFTASASNVNVIGSASHPTRSMTLTTIPRTSSITLNKSSVEAGGQITVNISRESTSFDHRVRWTFGNTQSTLRQDVISSDTLTVPLSWLSEIPNGTSGTASVRVDTYSGSTLVGGVTKTFTITAPASVVPSFSSLNVTRLDNDVPSAWGVYVQGHSGVQAEIVGASGIYGSTISSYRVQIGSTTIGTSAVSTHPVLNTAGSRTITATITDSRGRTATKTQAISVLAYSPPKILSSSVTRALSNGTIDNEGTYGRAVVDYSFSAVGANAVTRKVEYREKGTTTWINGGSFNDNVARIFGGGNISVDDSYDLRVTVQDALSDPVVWTGELGTAFVTMDFLAGGRGVALGKVSELTDIFDVNFKTRFSGGIDMIRIPAGSNFNSYTLPGFYFNSSNADMSTMINKPSSYAGTLVVLQSISVTQLWFEHGSGNVTGKIWRRSLHGASSWEVLWDPVDTSWKPLTLASGWSNYGSDLHPAEYMIDKTGRVNLRGTIKSSSPDTVACTLPFNFRPSKREIFGTISSDSFCRIQIDTNGQVKPLGASSTYVSLAGISFSTN